VRRHDADEEDLPVADDKLLMFLNGTAMSGQKDHGAVGASKFLGPARTAPRYRFYAVRDEFPGLVLAGDAAGFAIVGELYEMDHDVWRTSLLPAEPEELDPGWVELDDGRRVRVMVLDLARIKPGDEFVEISAFGGWRAYQASRAETAQAE
jgi:hypothetical protein